VEVIPPMLKKWIINGEFYNGKLSQGLKSPPKIGKIDRVKWTPDYFQPGWNLG